MDRFAHRKNPVLGVLATLLILTLSLWALGRAVPYASAKERNPEKTEVSQKLVSNAGYADVSVRVTLATFLFYWIAKAFAVADGAILHYRNCKAFFVNPSSFNAYYTHLSALAP